VQAAGFMRKMLSFAKLLLFLLPSLARKPIPENKKVNLLSESEKKVK
jgi:hypothetical protein